MSLDGIVQAVCKSTQHRFSKQTTDRILVIEGLGVEGDVHSGKTVQHLSRVRANPDQPNLRQVHLIQGELFDDLAAIGFALQPGDLGENITTRGIDLLGLSRDTLLHLGNDVVLKVTGLRNPCGQIEAFAPGLLKHVAIKTEAGIVRRAGIMTIVVKGGEVRPGDSVAVEAPASEHIPLERV